MLVHCAKGGWGGGVIKKTGYATKREIEKEVPSLSSLRSACTYYSTLPTLDRVTTAVREHTHAWSVPSAFFWHGEETKRTTSQAAMQENVALK